jgi:predicted MFS family arabinose efflux permease
MSTTAAGLEPTETSPLLPTISNTSNGSAIAVDPSAGLVVNGADAHRSIQDDALASDEYDGNGLERHASGSSLRKFQGMPDVKQRMVYIMPALGIGVILAAADQTIIVSSYGKIGSDLDALSSTSWIATAYFLTLTSIQPLYGKLSDIFGRKHCLLFAYIVFGLGCLFCGLAQSMTQLIIARAFAGIGGGGMTTVGSILLSDVVPLRDRGTWQGYINIIYATGAAAGAPLGGILSDTIGWRWAFLAQAPLCLIAFVAVGLVLQLPRNDDSHWKEKLRRIDFIGALVLLAAVVCLVFGVDRGGNKSWTDKYTLITVIASVPLLVLFSIVEIFLAQEPFTPGHIIFERSLFAAYLCNFFSFAGYMAALFYVPLYFQAANDLSATQAGLRLIPAVICSVSGSLSSGIYMKRTGKYYWITVICYAGLLLGMTVVLLCSGVAANSQAGIIVGLCISAFSNGIGVTTTLIALISNAKHQDQAIATACSYLFRSLGSVLGVSLAATAANSALRFQLKQQLGDSPDVSNIANRIRQSLDYVRTLDPHLRGIIEDCYGKSTQASFALCIALVLGSAVSAWFIREKMLGD